MITLILLMLPLYCYIILDYCVLILQVNDYIAVNFMKGCIDVLNSLLNPFFLELRNYPSPYYFSI